VFVEALRKQARSLENEIDSKLMTFSKLCSNYQTGSPSTSNTYSSLKNNLSPSTSQGASSSSEMLYLTLSNEIDDALKKLTNVNGKMTESLSIDSNQGLSSANNHTLQV
jgi:golgi SNAP receptor complex member 1